jgi:hypothetical protein
LPLCTAPVCLPVLLRLWVSLSRCLCK